MMIDTPTLYQTAQTYLAQGRTAAAERYLLATLSGYQTDRDLSTIETSVLTV